MAWHRNYNSPATSLLTKKNKQIEMHEWLGHRHNRHRYTAIPGVLIVFLSCGFVFLHFNILQLYISELLKGKCTEAYWKTIFIIKTNNITFQNYILQREKVSGLLRFVAYESDDETYQTVDLKIYTVALYSHRNIFILQRKVHIFYLKKNVLWIPSIILRITILKATRK